MTGWQAAALGLAIWALAVGFILGLVAGGTRKPTPDEPTYDKNGNLAGWNTDPDHFWK